MFFCGQIVLSFGLTIYLYKKVERGIEHDTFHMKYVMECMCVSESMWVDQWSDSVLCCVTGVLRVREWGEIDRNKEISGPI